MIWVMVGGSAVAKAQDKSTQYSDQQWIQYYEQAKLNNHWTLLADAGYRRKDVFANMSQYIARVAAGYQLNNYMRLAAGFANLGFYTNNTLSKLEFRPFEEWMITNRFNVIKIQQRFRFEERFFKEVNEGIRQASFIFNFRFRYRLMFNFPILSLSPSNKWPKLFLNAGNELLVNTGRNIANNISDEFRILIGPALKLNKNFTIALTYNSEFASSTTPGSYKHTDVIWLGIKHQFRIKKL